LVTFSATRAPPQVLRRPQVYVLSQEAGAPEVTPRFWKELSEALRYHGGLSARLTYRIFARLV
jgi:hypothetical protein